MATANLPIKLSLRPIPPRSGFSAVPDPVSQSQYYEGVVSRRVVAYVIDICLYGLVFVAAIFAGLIINIATFGLMHVLVIVALACLAPAYHVLTVGGPHAATPGMRLMGLQVRSFDGGPPSKMQAFIQIALFYVTVPTTGGWILLFMLFNSHRRAVHDLLSHTVVLRRAPNSAGGRVRAASAGAIVRR
jgi:uncharacterized RDD family membrane protein YckC